MTTEDPTSEDTTTAAAGQADSQGTQGDQLDDLDEVLGEWRDDASLATAMGTAIGDTRAAHLMADRLQVFRRRVVQDALKQGTSAYWRRRAADFDPRPSPQRRLPRRRRPGPSRRDRRPPPSHPRRVPAPSSPPRARRHRRLVAGANQPSSLREPSHRSARTGCSATLPVREPH